MLAKLSILLQPAKVSLIKDPAKKRKSSRGRSDGSSLLRISKGRAVGNSIAQINKQLKESLGKNSTKKVGKSKETTIILSSDQSDSPLKGGNIKGQTKPSNIKPSVKKST